MTDTAQLITPAPTRADEPDRITSTSEPWLTAVLIERDLTLWIHTEELWRELESALGLPRYHLGRFKEWNALGPKHLDTTCDLDAAQTWARERGIPHTVTASVHYPGTTGTVGSDDQLTVPHPGTTDSVGPDRPLSLPESAAGMPTGRKA
ncbi:hypothetical protein [Nocardia sp. XZ_19_369]|uniref:hypothetical protein n=1 Tax=Nocardia sp. XZ_19_369 TaxID=2769487 RepID=UPI00188F7AEB|nr:hypothetical protein [Nocardia sp. XZ_19_369]